MPLTGAIKYPRSANKTGIIVRYNIVISLKNPIAYRPTQLYDRM